MDASTLDAVGRDSGRDARVDPADAGADAKPDAIVVDAGGPQPDANVDRFDAGFDAPMGCPPMCPPDTYCDDERCVPYCTANADCDPGLVCFESGFCGEPECENDEHCADPAGAGCTQPICSAGVCNFVPFDDFDPLCQVCDPRIGEVRDIDNDGDGFAPCQPGCDVPTASCDCNDDNPGINPASLAALGEDVNVEAICTGAMAIPGGVLFCVSNEDSDDAVVFRRFVVGMCRPENVMTFAELLAALRLGGGLDCDDAEFEVKPNQEVFMSDPRPDCDLPRGCFDYNCDRREEREYPAFEHCHRIFTEDACEDSAGWERASADDSVPVCGEEGVLLECVWSDEGCTAGAASSHEQGCR